MLNSRSVRPVHQSLLRMNDFTLDFVLARIREQKRQRLAIIEQRQKAWFTLQDDCDWHTFLILQDIPTSRILICVRADVPRERAIEMA